MTAVFDGHNDVLGRIQVAGIAWGNWRRVLALAWSG
ncbi:MAG: hypothetical protein V7607_6014 [Solirubrobacteraceae bacterium]